MNSSLNYLSVPLNDRVKVFFVEAKNDKKEDLIIDSVAIDPQILQSKFGPQTNYLEWYDTGGRRRIKIYDAQIDKKSMKVIFFAKGGMLYTFRPLTLVLYRENVQKHVAGQPDFQSQEELIHYYLHTNFWAF